ncbi:MAG: CHASE domain-containing protein [Methylococcales bacterium]
MSKILNFWLTSKHSLIAYLLLFLGLLTTLYLSSFVKADLDRNALRQFTYICEEVQLKIEAHLQSHKQVLLGGVALFNASSQVTRDEWHDFAKLMQIDKHFKGIQGLGFSLLIKKPFLAQHVADTRQQGFPDYEVIPKGERDLYSSIIYLEPFTERNMRAFGYDMYAEKIRHAAMQHAVDYNQVALSGKVKLMQESDAPAQAGTLMYAPVYKKGLPIETVSQRHAALIGWVYSPFRMNDFFSSILDDWYNPNRLKFNLRVYDGDDANPEHLLFNSVGNVSAVDHKQFLTIALNSDFNGHEWRLYFDQIEPFSVDYSKVWLALLSGAAASFALFLLLLSYQKNYRKTLQFSNQTEAALKQKSQELDFFFDISLDLLCIADMNGKFLRLNPEWSNSLGYQLSELQNHNFRDFIHPEDLPATQQALAKLSEQLPVLNLVNRYRHQNGSYRWIEWRAVPHEQLIFAAASDVTERIKTEKVLQIKRERLLVAIQGATDGLWDWNLDTNEVYYSPGWQAKIGYEEHELTATWDTWKQLVHPQDQARVLQHAQDYIHGNIPKYEVEFRMRHKQGHWLNFLSRAKLAVDSEDKPLVPRRLIGTHLDITDRKHEEQRRIAEQIALRDTLVQEVHHRIKNNMQGISGILRQFSQMHPQLAEPINHAISQMQTIAIIHGLQGRNTLSKVRLCELISAICQGVGRLWKTPIQYKLQEGWIPWIIAETEAVPIALALNELILNAVKHTDYHRLVKIEINNHPQLDGIEVVISNTGQLPDDFDTYRYSQAITGLKLVTSLLPRQGANLAWAQQENWVFTSLSLEVPIIKQEDIYES